MKLNIKVFFLNKKLMIPAIAGFALVSWFTWYVWNWEHRESVLEVHFFDVAKGSAVFIRTPNGKTALVGGGQGSDIIRKLTDVMPFYRRRIDTVVFPADSQNGIGLVDVLNRYDIGREIHVASSTSAVDILLDETGAMQVRLSSLAASTSSPLLVSYGNSNFLFADAISRKDQQILVGLIALRRNVDVLQLRSAAQTKISTNFFNSISPKNLVVSKMPQVPKPSKLKIEKPKKTEVINVSTKPKKLSKSKKPTKALKPKSPPKILPSKDPPFNLFTQSTVRIFALDRKGTVTFVSDGKKITAMSEK